MHVIRIDTLIFVNTCVACILVWFTVEKYCNLLKYTTKRTAKKKHYRILATYLHSTMTIAVNGTPVKEVRNAFSLKM